MLSMSWITDAVTGQSPVISPDAPAVALAGGTPVTWGELRRLELGFASALVQTGVKKGDRVGILMRNSTDYFVCILALARAGAIAVRLNWRLTAPELKFMLVDSETSLLILDDEFVESIGSIRDEIPARRFVARNAQGLNLPDWVEPLDEFVSGDAVADFPACDLDDPLSLMYTSGTTGLPKGVIWTHGNTLWFGAIQIMKWKLDQTTRGITIGPLFHGGGWEAVLLPTLMSHGLAIASPSGSFDLRQYLGVASAQGATIMLMYNFFVQELMKIPGCKDLMPDSVRQIVMGGDCMPPAMHEKFYELFSDIELFQVYGLTEGGAITTCLDSKNSDRVGSVGKPLPLNEVRLVRADGTLASVGEIAEVQVRGPNVSPGFWRRPEENISTFVDGWCRTGDLGRVDADGFLTLCGREKDMIRSKGENIYPAEIEAVLASAPSVAEAVVVGVPDDDWVEVGCAILVAAPGAAIEIDAVRRHCGAHIAKFKIPRHFVIVPEIPRTPQGKPKKALLREQYRDIAVSA